MLVGKYAAKAQEMERAVFCDRRRRCVLGSSRSTPHQIDIGGVIEHYMVVLNTVELVYYGALLLLLEACLLLPHLP